MSRLPAVFDKLRFPVIGSPLFIISNPKLVIAQCTSGVVGSMPALNARPAEQLDEWLAEISEALAAWDKANPDNPAAPFAINQIVHKSNDRLEHDMQLCAKYKVPIIITSLGAREDVNQAVHGWGGVVLHDVISNVFAHKAIEKGADGLIPVAAGAGGHASVKSPFAMVQEIRQWFDGPLALSGSIASGGAILAAQAMGADFAYIGSAFIATEEARAVEGYKQMICDSNSDDIVYSNFYTGIHVNLHSDGYILNVMDDIIEMGYTLMHPVQESAGMDPRKIKDEYGDKIVIYGSLDVVDGLYGHEGEELDRYIEERFAIYAPGGGFIFNTGHFVQPDIPPQRELSRCRNFSHGSPYRAFSAHPRYHLETIRFA